MTTLIDYTFNATTVKNPDGKVPVILPNDAHIVDGPGSFQGQQLPKAVRLGASSAVQADISSLEIVNESRYHARIVFHVEAAFSGRQVLAESERLPFLVELSGTGTSVKLTGSVRTTAVNWRGTETFSSPDMTLNAWHSAELVYDLDTLFIFLDGAAISCHGFGANGNIELAQAAHTVIIGGANLTARFTGGIATFLLEADIPIELQGLCDQLRFSPQWYITTKLELFRFTYDLGEPKAAAAYDVMTFTWSQPYSTGLMMYHESADSAFEMHGFIRSRYEQLNSTTKSALGFLVTDEISASDQSGRKSMFQGGCIYWSSASGAFEVLGQIFLAYESNGESSSGGFPLGPPRNIVGGIMQQMQHSNWYYKTNAPSGHVVTGSILTAFLNTGGTDRWGFPTSNESFVQHVPNHSDNSVRLIEFEGCSFYSSPQTGAHSTYGDIRLKWLDLKGPQGALGLPTTDEMNAPGSGARMNGFEHGVLVWYGSFASLKVINPFKLFLGNLNTVESEGFGMGQNDIYFMATINKGSTTIFRQRYPGSGDFGNNNVLTVNIEFPPVLTPDPLTGLTMIIDVWDSDGGAPFGGGDDNLGTWVKVLDASNAWGLQENGGILHSGSFAKINNITAAVHPQIDLTSLTEVDKYWAASARNRGTDPIDYQTYAEAFRDVDSDPEAWDPLDWLDKAFYEGVARHLAKGGNCFGMSLEAIYARKGLSLYSMPLSRFGDWNVLGHIFNVKHQFQVGASGIWWFVSQFLSGNTHDPVRVFNETRDAYNSGNPAVLCLAQNFDFSGSPHCVLPVTWNSGGPVWTVGIHDPNFPDQIRTLTVNPADNTFRYDGGSVYTGGEWSGGRLHYLPWSVLCTTPRTPVWDAILLILAGTIIIMGSDTETAAINSLAGANISAHSSRATDALKAGRHLNGYFTKAPVVMAGDFPGEILLTRGRQIASTGILPMRPGFSVGDHALANTNLSPVLSLHGLGNQLALLNLSDTTDFKHEIRGKAGGGTHQHFIKSGNTHISIISTIHQAETTFVEAKKLGTINAELALSHTRGKDHEIVIMQRLGMSRDSVCMKFNLTSTAAGTFTLAPRPGMGVIELKPGNVTLSAAKVTVAMKFGRSSLTHEFDLSGPAGARLDVPMRLKLPIGQATGRLGLARLNAGDLTKVLDSRIISGRPITDHLGGLGLFGGLGRIGAQFGHLGPGGGVLGHLGAAGGVLGHLGAAGGVLGHLAEGGGGAAGGT